jgi:hypothetical protein
MGYDMFQVPPQPVARRPTTRDLLLSLPLGVTRCCSMAGQADQVVAVTAEK